MEHAILFSALEPLLDNREPCDRVYFGHEFCQRRMPSVPDVRKAMAWAAGRGLSFTLVTPFVTNAGLRHAQDLIRTVAEDGSGLAPEVVVNDWGALRWTHHEFPGLSLALGRLLTKQKRGPRILQIAQRIPETALDHFMRSNVDVPHVAAVLRGMSVDRVELDNLLQGIRRSHGLPASLYHPFAYVSTTRLCLLMGGDRRGKNFRSIGRCARECQVYDVTLTHHNMPVPLLLRGNTYFFRNDKLPADLDALGIDRLVFEPSLP